MVVPNDLSLELQFEKLVMRLDNAQDSAEPRTS